MGQIHYNMTINSFTKGACSMRYVLFLALFLIQLPVMARVVTDDDTKRTLGRPAGEVFGVLNGQPNGRQYL